MLSIKHLKENINKVVLFINSNVVIKNVIINAIFLLFFILIGPIYEENDDPGMEQIVSGFYEEPYSYVPFMNIFLGKILSTLYKIIPCVKWYVLIMYVFMYVSFCVLSCLIEVIINHDIAALIKYPFLITMGYEIYSKFQFTKISGISTVAGFSLFIYLLFTEKEKRTEFRRSQNLLLHFVSILLIWFGSAVRLTAFFLVLPFVFIVLFRETIKCMVSRKKLKSDMVRLILYAFAVIVIVGIPIIINDNEYRSQENWKYYSEWNKQRSELVDYSIPDYYENEEEYTAIGLSENDFYLLRHWGFGDVDFYTSDLLDKVIRFTKEKSNYSIDFDKVVKKAIPSMLFGYTGRLFLFFLFAYLLLKHKNILDTLCATGLMVLLFLLACYFTYLDRILNRTNVVVGLGAMMVLLFCLGNTTAKVEINRTLIALVVGGVFIMNINAYFDRIEYYNASIEKASKYKEQTLRIAEDHDTLYVNDVSQNIFEEAWSGVFDRRSKNVRFDNVVSMGGWNVNSPAWKARIYNKGIGNIFRDSVDNDNLLFITNESRKPYIEKYIGEHYNPNARLEKVREFQNGIGYYRVISVVKLDEFDNSDRSIEASSEDIVHFVRVIDNGDTYYVDGTVYKDGSSSYNQKVYLSSDSGVTVGVTQKESSERDDDMHGKFGNFSVEINKNIIGQNPEELKVLLDSDGLVYEIPVDQVGW